MKFETGSLKAERIKLFDPVKERTARKAAKGHRLRSLRSFAVIFMMASRAFAADVTITVTPPIISLGESAQVKVEVRDARRPTNPAFPSTDGLRISGTGKSSQTSIINGKVDKSVSYSATIYPQRTGEFSIGPFEYKVDGEIKQLTGRLKVVATSGDAAASQSWNDVTFARIASNRQQVYVQEPFDLTLSIYSRTDVQLAGNINLQGLPETGLSGPEWEEIPNGKREQLDGVLYDVRQFKTSLRAMGSGEFRFAPVVTVQVAAPQQQQQQRRRDPFGFGLFNSVQTIPVELEVEPATVQVLPLPTDGKPDGFSGAVGRFQFQVTADPKEVSPGDPITLQMTIVGEGNYDRILPPALPAEAPFRLFGEAVRQQGNNGVRFEQVISPRDETVTEIPAIGFSYFDSESGAYRTVSSQRIPITVNASSNHTAQLFAAQETLSVAPADTPFATESDIQRMTGWLKAQWKRIHPWLWTLPAALGLGLVLFGIQKFVHWRRKDTAWMRRQQAPKAARKALRAATAAMEQSDIPGFYNSLWNALTGYFGNRLNLPPGDVTLNQMTAILTDARLSEHHLETLKQLYNTVEQYRYGAMSDTSGSEEMESLRTGLIRLLKAAEKINT